MNSDFKNCQKIVAEHFYYTPGDKLKFELWILNDAPVPFDGDKVDVYFTVDGNKKHIITWNAPKADAAKNIRGHQVIIDVPYTSTQIVTVTLEANCGTSEYKFLLSNEPAKDEFIPQLNI